MIARLRAMKRWTLVCFLLAFAMTMAWGRADESWIGVYMRGSKIGHAKFTSRPETQKGVQGTLSEAQTVMSLKMLGADLEIRLDSRTFSDANGRPLTMWVKQESAGRSQTLDAKFEGDKVRLDVDNNGNKSDKTIDVPKDAWIVDDPLTALLAGSPQRTFYILDSTTLTLVKNELNPLGEREVDVQGTKVKAQAVEIKDPRMTSTAFFTAKGDLIKMTGPLGIEMIPEPKEKALARPEGAYVPADLATASSIEVKPKLGEPAQYRAIELRLSGLDLSHLPSGDHQTVTKRGDAWIVKVHPPTWDEGRGKKEVAQTDAKWAQPSPYVASDYPAIRSVAADIAKGASTRLDKAMAIKDWVYQHMRSNAGIGVLRDAREVLATKEGVCRDYAILAASLMRAVDIPTRLASGLTLWNDRFYYHAWVEVWDGNRWIGLDPTESREQISPTHVKLGEGNVEDAFFFTILEGVRIEVLGTTKR